MRNYGKHKFRLSVEANLLLLNSSTLPLGKAIGLSCLEPAEAAAA